MLKIPLLVSLGHHGGRRKVASLRPPFSTPLRSLGEPDPDTPFLVPIEHAPPLFVRIWEDKISLKIPPPPLFLGRLISFFFTQKPTKPTENTRIMLGSVTSVCLEGAYAHYHPEVVDILFWAVLLEW